MDALIMVSVSHRRLGLSKDNAVWPTRFLLKCVCIRIAHTSENEHPVNGSDSCTEKNYACNFSLEYDTACCHFATVKMEKMPDFCHLFSQT